jgi:hypothetical protein
MTSTAASTGVLVKIAIVLALYVALVIGGGIFGKNLSDGFDITIWPHTEPMVNTMIVSGMLLYIILTAIPFVPGIELGLALILAFGVQIVPAVYAATIAALMLAYCVGMLVPERWLAQSFRWFGLSKAARMVDELVPLDAAARVNHLVAQAPNKYIPWLLRHRHTALALLFNMPGSALLGGGGGIAMATGMSGLMRFPAFLLTAAIAVSPVPLFLIATAALGLKAG